MPSGYNAGQRDQNDQRAGDKPLTGSKNSPGSAPCWANRPLATDDWLEFSVQTDREAAEAVSEVFNRFGTGGAVVEQVFNEPREEADNDVPLTVKTFIPAHDVRIRQTLEQALHLLSRIRDLPEPRIRLLPKEEWAESWKHHFCVQHIGERIVIVPSWIEYAPQAREIIIHLDPGLAFGTGLHPTTRLCLQAMEHILKPGDTVLDVGTGSGILSIAAVKMGSPAVLALDTDLLATKVARQNVELNEVSHHVLVVRGSIAKSPVGLALASCADVSPPTCTLRTGGYDLTVANIIAEAIIELAEALVASLAPNGHLIVSGIIRDRAAAVRVALSTAGLKIVDELQEGDWLALLGRRMSPCTNSSYHPNGSHMIP